MTCFAIWPLRPENILGEGAFSALIVVTALARPSSADATPRSRRVPPVDCLRQPSARPAALDGRIARGAFASADQAAAYPGAMEALGVVFTRTKADDHAINRVNTLHSLFDGYLFGHVKFGLTEPFFTRRSDAGSPATAPCPPATDTPKPTWRTPRPWQTGQAPPRAPRAGHADTSTPTSADSMTL